MLFGEFCQKKRREAGMSLRDFCEKFGFDKGRISKMEHGKVSPPVSFKSLEYYARCLNITVGTPEWLEYCDLAAIGSKRIPKDLTQQEFMDKLPLCFVVLRSAIKDEDKMAKLMAMAAESNVPR